MTGTRARVSLAVVLVGLVALVVSCKGPGASSQESARAALPAAGAPAATTPAALPTEFPKPGAAGKVTLYYPCGLINPFNAVLDEIGKLEPKLEIERVYDNADVIVRRIVEKNEPADVVVTPGDTEMRNIEKAGKVDPTAKRAFGTFELVAVVNRESGITLEKPEDLLTVKTVTIPQPDRNGVGDAAKEALTKLGLWDRINTPDKTIFTDHPVKSYELVSQRKADVALCWNACPLETNPEKMSADVVQIAFTFDASLYTQQHCWVAPLRAAKDPKAARAFVDWLTAPAVLGFLETNGVAGAAALASAPVAPVKADASAAAGESAAAAAGGVVTVELYYPGNDGHAPIRDLVGKIEQRYAGKATAEFIDFGTAEGGQRMRDKGLTCGTVLVNGNAHWEVEDPDGTVRPVTFEKGMGTMWQEADLYRVLDKLTGVKTAQ